MMPKIAGITKVRNESRIIADTLDHFADFCNAGIYVYDDCSDDDTASLCQRHEAVEGVIVGTSWDRNRKRAEWQNRAAALAMARKAKPDWILCFDADERIEFNAETFDWLAWDAVRMRLFDFYITPEDVDLEYHQRRWVGPEFRRIIMLYRDSPEARYHKPDQRVVTLPRRSRVFDGGCVKHYGKAISVEEWEQTCDYYAKHFGEPYRSKWESRKGKAIHIESDFGFPLVTWENKDRHAVRLTRAIERRESRITSPAPTNVLPFPAGETQPDYLQET